MNWLRKNWLTLLQVAFSIFLISRVFGDAGLRREAVGVLSQANPWWVLGGLATVLASELLCAVRWSLMLRLFDIPVGFGRVCAFSFAGLFYSLLLPGAGGGDAFRILYVMRLYPGHKRRAALSVVADRLCGLVALAVALGVVALHQNTFPPGSPARQVLAASLIIVSIPVFLILIWWTTTIPRVQRKGLLFVPARFHAPLLALGEDFWSILHHPTKIALGIAVSCAALAAHFTTYFISSLAFGVPVGLAGMILIMPVVDALVLLPITFFGIGLRETLFQSLLGGMFGIAPGTAAVVALGGFGLQAAVGLLGGLLVPFTTPPAPNRR